MDEYDPLWPNEYEKVVKELRDNRDRESEKEEKRRDRRRKSRFNDPEDEVTSTPQMSLPPVASGFAGRNLRLVFIVCLFSLIRTSDGLDR